MGATELAPGEVLKGLLILAGIVVSLVVIFGATFFGWGDADEDRCEQIGADVEAGRYPVSGWETDKGATETELDWWLFGVDGGAGTTRGPRKLETGRNGSRPTRDQAEKRPTNVPGPRLAPLSRTPAWPWPARSVVLTGTKLDPVAVTGHLDSVDPGASAA